MAEPLEVGFRGASRFAFEPEPLVFESSYGVEPEPLVPDPRYETRLEPVHGTRLTTRSLWYRSCAGNPSNLRDSTSKQEKKND